MIQISPRFPARLAALLGATFAVQGCAGGMPQILGGGGSAPEQIVVPQTAPAPAATTPAPATTTAVDERAPLAVSATYLERILVPNGSELTLTARTASGIPALTRIRTSSGPPYEMSVPVSTADDAYPVTVTATLNSSIGHVLSGSVVLATLPSGPVEIVMRTGAN